MQKYLFLLLHLPTAADSADAADAAVAAVAYCAGSTPLISNHSCEDGSGGAEGKN